MWMHFVGHLLLLLLYGVGCVRWLLLLRWCCIWSIKMLFLYIKLMLLLIGRARRRTRGRRHVRGFMIAQTSVFDYGLVDYVQVTGSIGTIERRPLLMVLLLLILLHLFLIVFLVLCLSLFFYYRLYALFFVFNENLFEITQ
jgi:hypothetical protein